MERASVRLIDAAIHHRRACALYHSALVVWSTRGRFTVEQGPAESAPPGGRGVVATGPVGLRVAGRLRCFRYEVRCWRNGSIADLAEAVDSPLSLTADPDLADRVLAAAPDLPILTWGRDESSVGDMWNSNSVVAWLLTRAGVDAEQLSPPPGGRAPGWRAGIVVANRNRFSGT